MVIKHHDQANLQKKTFNLVYSFQGLEFMRATEQLWVHILIHNHGGGGEQALGIIELFETSKTIPNDTTLQQSHTP